MSGLNIKYQVLGKVKFWHTSTNDHMINNFWHILFPSQNCFSPIIQTFLKSKLAESATFTLFPFT